MAENIKQMSDAMLSESLGPSSEELTPENKHWILKTMLFKPVGRFRWWHPAMSLSEYIEFDVNTDNIATIPSKILNHRKKLY